MFARFMLISGSLVSVSYAIKTLLTCGMWLGYFPVGHTTVQRNRKDYRPHALVKSHPEVEAMRVKVTYPKLLLNLRKIFFSKIFEYYL